VELDDDKVAKLHDALQSTSFLHIREPIGEYTILMDETGMANKPAIHQELSVADILKSWSLFTPEQRAAFIEDKGRDLREAMIELGLTVNGRKHLVESFFDLQAGIFLAFGNLERRLSTALAAGREREVEYWLLGRQYDSILTLLERARNESPEGEGQPPIREYLMLLCTRQLVRMLKRDYPILQDRKYKEGMKAIEEELAKQNQVRSRFTFDSVAEREKFFEWFEKWFLERAKPVEVAS
jgi:hypothetical protein